MKINLLSIVAIILPAIIFSSCLFFDKTQDIKHNADKAPAAYHEFVMFGSDRIYLSHYTMFHAIHAYQAIIQVSLKKDNIGIMQAFLDNRRMNPDRTYTVSPSKKGNAISRRRDDWVLPDYIQEGIEFNADIHWGDNADEFLFRDVTVRVEKVIIFRKFHENDQRNNQLSYLIFGHKGEWYLAHNIAMVGDFDQIISVNLADDKLEANPYLQFIIDRKNDFKFNLEYKITKR